MWKCPECKKPIVRLSYWVAVNTSEYGTAHLSDSNENTPRDRITDHDYDDGGDTDWDGRPEYKCPECEEEIKIEDLEWDEETDQILEKIELKDPEPEETLHKIIKPKNTLFRNEKPKDSSDGTIICKQCKHIFVYGRGILYATNETCECPNCFTTNSIQEYQKLLLEGYY